MLTNPVLLSILIMMALCLLRCNVMLAILISAMCAVFLSSTAIENPLSLFIDGMGGNLETALSYVLLGVIASAIARTNLTAILVNKVSSVISNKKYLFIASIAFFSCFSQNLVPVHIAFIPILIPPLLKVMNLLKIDRRAVACALTFALQTPYMALPLGFGLIFFGLIQKNMTENGITVSLGDISSVMWLTAIPMLFGLILAIFVYRKPREYQEIVTQVDEKFENLKFGRQEIGVLLGIIVSFAIQLISGSMPLAALVGIITMILTGGIVYKNLDKTFQDGIVMMGYIAFVMLVAAGYGAVIKATGGIAELVNFAAGLSGGKFGGVLLMILIGLVITMGIGSSFGTIPIIATIYCPLALELGFSAAATILIIGIAAGIGDAGSPASDSTLGPTAGLNADGQHNHIYDTCVPTFIFFNIPLIVFGVIFAMFL